MDDRNMKLRTAVKDNDIEAVKTLLCAGANPNQFIEGNYSKITLLHYTANVEIAKELLFYFANVNAENVKGETPLMVALKNNKIECIGELCKNLANISEHLIYKRKSILSWAMLNSCEIESIMELFKNGEDINQQNGFCQNVLHFAAANRYYGGEVIVELIKKGADLTISDYDDKTPLWLALESDFPRFDVIKELIRYAAENKSAEEMITFFRETFSIAVKRNIRLTKYIITIVLIKEFDLYKHIFDLSSYDLYDRTSIIYKNVNATVNECLSEVDKMKSVILEENDNLSLYEFLRNNFIKYNKDQMCKLILLNNQICMKLSKINFPTEYPFFNDFIAEELKYFLERADLLKKINELRIYTKLYGPKEPEKNIKDKNEVNLDLLPKLKITEYLLNNDLLNFIRAFIESNED